MNWPTILFASVTLARIMPCFLRIKYLRESDLSASCPLNLNASFYTVAEKQTDVFYCIHECSHL
jgi:hypothetical protein